MCFQSETSKQKMVKHQVCKTLFDISCRVEDILQRSPGHTCVACVSRLGPLKLQSPVNVKDIFNCELKSNISKYWFSTTSNPLVTCRHHRGQKQRCSYPFLMRSAAAAVEHTASTMSTIALLGFSEVGQWKIQPLHLNFVWIHYQRKSQRTPLGYVKFYR